MEDAIADVPDNGTLVLDASTPVTDPIVIDKPMTIQGDGAKVDSISVQDAEVAIDGVTVSKVSVTGTKDFSLTNSTIDGGADSLSIDTTGEVTLSGNTFKDGE